MILTVEEAKRKYCCMAMHVLDAVLYCSADSCMAWCWAERSQNEVVADESCSRCKGDGVVLIAEGTVTDCHCVSLTKGYCGLAGNGGV